MLARFERLPAADFRYRILFGGDVALRLVPTSSEGPPLFPDRLCAVLARTAFGMPRRLTPRANRRKESWENHERFSPSQKTERGQRISGTNQAMPETDHLALWHALNQPMTNCWAEVDYKGGSRAHEFYLPEALFAVGNVTWSAIFGYSNTMRIVYGRSGDEPLPRRRSPTLSVGKTVGDDCGFRSPMRARRRPAVAFSVARPAADFCRQ